MFCAVAEAFNHFVLLYVATFGLPLYALLFSVPHLRSAQLGDAMGGRAARVVGIICTSVVGVGLGLLWVGICLSYLATGDVPKPIVNSGHPTGVVFAVDLVSSCRPCCSPRSGWYNAGRSAGVLAGVMSVGGSAYTLTLAAASVEVARQNVGAGSELPI